MTCIPLDYCPKPFKRYRFYWTNIPVNNTERIKEVASAVPVDDLIDEGYGAVARLLQSEDEQLRMPVKANNFLASISRIDDDRMISWDTNSPTHPTASGSPPIGVDPMKGLVHFEHTG